MRPAEKRPGWDWLVSWGDEDDDGSPTVETMTVFGAATIEEALRDARDSLPADGSNPIFAIRRSDHT